jgi:uncharacterized repeat protein (TIGR01451 family)
LFAVVLWFGTCTPAASQTKAAETGSDQAASGQQQDNAANAIADPVSSQQLIHIVPYGRNSSGIKNQSAPFGAHLTYFGGPVISNIQVVVVFWGPNINTAITANGTLDQFYTDITSSRFFDELTEYNTAGITGAPPASTSSNQTIGHGTFGGKFTITPSLCPGPTACTLTDAQIQAELTRQINSSALPAPQSDAHGIINTYYAIYFPPGVSINAGGVSSCVSGGFCAYHSNTASLVPYGVLPDLAPPSGCSLGCGNGTLFQNITAVSSHEMSEAITDAQVGTATVFGPPLAWYDGPNPNLGEIADLCLAQDVQVSAGSSTYVVQQNFSNVQNDCVSAPPVFKMTAPASGAGPALPFNLTLAIQSSVAPFTLQGYTGTVHFTSADPQAVLPADYTFVAGDAGTHVFSVTLGTLGDQTITVTDTHSSGFNGTTTVNVNTTPDLTITKTHTGNFSVGQTGATYTLTASNTGHGPTAGTVTVTDSLPAGLTATAISGTGWSCTLGTLTCTRADALAASASYPSITLTVNVAANAPSGVLNTATVSGGGETNTANDSVNDPTTILAPDMTVSKQHAGAINGAFFQGETGATYSIFVSNNGNLATIGAVSVVDTLPATGLTATDISGTGWSCTLNNLTCTRSDVLAPGAAYPGITVTVNVASDAPDHVFNLATVSGGGEVNTGNDFAQDLTIVLPPLHPDLTPFMNHSISNFVQGQSGIYRIDISNVGTAVTSGAVTVSDTLPTGLTATDMSGVGWTCSAGATSSCTQSTPLVPNDSYAPIFLTVNIAANAPASVVNTVTVSGGGDTVSSNNSFSDPTQIAVPLVDLSPQVSGSGFAGQGQTGVSYTIFINNFGNIPSSGTVTLTINLSTGLTATALSGGGWNCTVSNLTCIASTPVTPSGVSIVTVTMNVANNAPASATVGATVSGGGDGNSANNTASLGMTIQPMVSISPGQSSSTVNAGQPAQFSMNVNPLPSSGGPAVMSCSGLPAASSCTFTPPSVPNNVGGQFVSLVISTTARTVAATLPPGPGNRTPIMPLAALGLAGMTAIVFKRRLRLMPRRRLALGTTALLLLLGALSGCGGGGGGGNQQIVTQQGTPAGTYTITVTATTPNETATTPMTLIVR